MILDISLELIITSLEVRSNKLWSNQIWELTGQHLLSSFVALGNIEY